jgi:abhydrolase domain-containing protein 6
MRSNFIKALFVLVLLLSGFCNAEVANSKCQIISGSVALDEGEIKYLSVGSGKAVLLLHGLFAQKEQWSDFACELSKGGYVVYAPDLPGYGQSVGFALANYQLASEASLIHKFTQKLGIQKFDVAGNSMGGAIAALLANQYPNEVNTLAFIGAPMGIVGWSPQIRAAMYKGINPFIPVTVDQFNLEMSLLFSNPPVIESSIKEAAVKEFTVNNRHYQQVWDIVNLDIGVLDTISNVRKPAFIIWGQDDGIFSVSGRVKLDKKYPNSISSTMTGASHLIMVEKPIEVADLYRGFLKASIQK